MLNLKSIVQNQDNLKSQSIKTLSILTQMPFALIKKRIKQIVETKIKLKIFDFASCRLQHKHFFLKPKTSFFIRPKQCQKQIFETVREKDMKEGNTPNLKYGYKKERKKD